MMYLEGTWNLPVCSKPYPGRIDRAADQGWLRLSPHASVVIGAARYDVF
ncbi:hypothetical protein [Pedobacter nyackensis]|nr:hypothetical protein [Pedobacter nyackensis]